MTATAERTTPAAATSTVPNELWEMVRSTLETSVWAQDQLDTLTRAWLDQARVARHDGLRVIENLMEQTKTNQEEMFHMLETNFRQSMSWVPNWVSFDNR
ncbi:MAG TPA: hypothetical protein V6D05_00610 [Stenomitos sp.]